MREFMFSPEALELLREQRFSHPHPRVRRKLEVLWLKAKGVPHTEIARLTELSRRSVQRHLDEFLDGGLDASLEVRFAKPVSRLLDHEAVLREHFHHHPPRSAREAQADIARLTGLRRSLSQVRSFLKKLSNSPGARSA